MKRKDFSELPTWKQTEIRQKVGLFQPIITVIRTYLPPDNQSQHCLCASLQQDEIDCSNLLRSPTVSKTFWNMSLVEQIQMKSVIIESNTFRYSNTQCLRYDEPSREMSSDAVDVIAVMLFLTDLEDYIPVGLNSHK